jgi:hypothetical protein
MFHPMTIENRTHHRGSEPVTTGSFQARRVKAIAR